jgi:hypothetical protein
VDSVNSETVYGRVQCFSCLHFPVGFGNGDFELGLFFSITNETTMKFALLTLGVLFLSFFTIDIKCLKKSE